VCHARPSGATVGEIIDGDVAGDLGAARQWNPSPGLRKEQLGIRAGKPGNMELRDFASDDHWQRNRFPRSVIASAFFRHGDVPA